MIKIYNLTATVNVENKVLKPDANGFRYVNLGALNVENTSGDYYLATNRTLNLFSSPTSLLNKRIRDKKLFGEYKHPKLTPEMRRELSMGESKNWIRRNLMLEDDRLALQIKAIDVFEDPKIIDKKTGKKKIMIKGWVRGFGPYGKIVEDALSNGDTSASFSIRVIANEYKANGRMEIEILIISTWDFVSSPGIAGSSDQFSVATESSEIRIEDIEAIEEYICHNCVVGEGDEMLELKEFVKSVRMVEPSRNNLLKDWR